MEDIQPGTKSLTSRAAFDDYIAGFNSDDYSRYCAYYSKDIVMDLKSLEDKTLSGYLNWIKPLHASVSEELRPKKVAIDVDKKYVAVDVDVQFLGRDGFKTENFAGKWGHVYPGAGPLVHMSIWYHLDPEGHIYRLESTQSYVLEWAQPPQGN
ncbi:unnamed protein product [Parascedosporium putredinis]|uniref:SnoaL-like domain-containing protein n=1 Tax=Parascedosporium putredinis TaxID=1442378 RepID=A0A9P1H078_9PEZI|nr:unnamed protein product [Parascedosporium putredinis]CAI7992524.1 unnamed protein product [Parascedosporium putredinis]